MINWCNHYMINYSGPCPVCAELRKEAKNIDPIKETIQHEPFNDRSQKLPYGAYSKRQIPVKRALKKAKTWKPGL